MSTPTFTDHETTGKKKFLTASHAWRLLAWAIVTLLLIARAPMQWGQALNIIQASNSSEVAELDPQLLNLALNVGVVMAVFFASLLFLIYQGIGAKIENRLNISGRLGFGPFWLVSLSLVGGTHLVTLAASFPSIRGYVGWYVALPTVGVLIGMAYLKVQGTPIHSKRSAIMLAVLAGYSLLAGLF